MWYNMLKVVKKIASSYFLAIKGYIVWNKILSKLPEKIKNNKRIIFILLPKDDLEVAYYSLAYLEKAIIFHQLDDAVILCTDRLEKAVINVFLVKERPIVYISSEEYNKLIGFYNLFEFDTRFLCMSLDDCEGRKGRILLGKKGINVSDLVSIGLYKLKHQCKPQVVTTNCNKIGIENFLNNLR